MALVLCTDLRSKLTIKNSSDLMVIDLNGPPLNKWNPEMYVKSCITKHRTAEDKRSRKVNVTTDSEFSKQNLWDIF